MRRAFGDRSILLKHLWWPGGLILLATVSMFWLPVFLAHQTILNGDFTLIDLPFAGLQSAALRGRAALLWSDGIYGGHPVFAEGQGGFAHPLTIVWAAIVTPLLGIVPAANLIHWLLMLIGGAGMLALCRTLGTSPGAACFAMLALVFAPIWTDVESNLPVSNALAWVPWSLWAMERWLKRPTLAAAALLAVAGVLVILAGYPQAFHGMILYMMLSLAVTPFFRAGRRDWRLLGRRRLLTGIVAVGLCSGLAAVQLLPLLELAGLSVRNAGVSLLLHLPLGAYLRGLLFAARGQVGLTASTFSGIGSALVMVVASVVLVVDRRPRIIGHLLAALVLFQLGCERSSLLFRLLYDHDLLPGLRLFRVVHLYFNIAAIGIAVLAAFAIDGLVAWGRGATDPTATGSLLRRRCQLACLALLIAIWFWAGVQFQSQDLPRAPLFIAGLAAIGGALLMWRGRSVLVPPFLVLLLLADCLVSARLRPFQFFDGSTQADRTIVAVIKRTPDWQEFKLYNDSLSIVNGLVPAQAPDLDRRIHRMLSALPAMTTLELGLASMNGPLALPLARRMAIEPVLQDEIEGKSLAPAGRRLIDTLSVRFVALDGPPQAAAFQALLPNGPDRGWIVENTAALPRFRLYFRHRFVPSIDAALAAVKDQDPTTLVLEAPPDTTVQGDPDATAPEPIGQIEVISTSATDYRFRVTTEQPAWLFLADANYPGWTASVDGDMAPIYSAEILGKAVRVPAGTHEIAVRFTSRSYEWGLLISLLSAGLLAAIFWRRWRAVRPLAGRI